MLRLLPHELTHGNVGIRTYPRSRKPLALLVALVLCLFAFVLSSNEAWANEAWAKEQPSSTEQPTVESTMIVNGKQVAELAPAPTSPMVSSIPAVETYPVEKLPPPPADSVPPKADPEPAPQPTPLQRTVVSTVLITTTGGETVGPSAEPASPPQQASPLQQPQESEPAPTESAPTTTPSKTATVSSASAAPTPPTPDLGSPETEIPAAAEEGPAALPAGLSAPSEVSAPVIPAPALQQVTQKVASQEEAWTGYYSTSGIAPTSPAVQPLTRALTNFVDIVDTNTSAAASAVAGVLGTIGGWLAEAPSGDEDSSSSSYGGTTPEPFAPLTAQPLGSSYFSLFSGVGQASTEGTGAPLLLGVLLLTSSLLLRREIRTYLVSCELPKPSSALPVPLERPG